ncbi:MFS transporter [Mesobacillus maritimus]|uniref:MFS transporter n=1 Tax=Mesobacillus maritimus TaxID=1643336 RepID=UPI00203EA044|nr:MFS transporter [Mesobacillus maritimus]MCM3585815.1 MFS transporter [Mesobacillus maritimus]MCM3670575.1 MFS transporter [Mesobacillus maritimus]
MSGIQPGTSSYKQAKFALFIAGLVPFMLIYTVQPTLPLFADEFNVSAPVASLTLSFTTGLLAVTLLVAGSFSEKIGMKKMMVLSMIMTSIFAVLSSFSPNFITLLLFRTFLGVVVAGVPSIAMAYIGKTFHPLHTAMIMGFYISGSSIGGMSGRLLTGLLTDLFTWRTAFAIIGIVTLLLSFLFWYTLPTTKKQSDQASLSWSTILKWYQNHITNRQLNYLFLLGFLLMGSFVSMYNYIGFLLVKPPYNLSQAFIGFIFIVYLCGTFSSIYMGKKASQYGKTVILKLSFVITIAGVLISLIPVLVFKIAGLAIFTFGFFASHSIVSSLVTERAHENKAQASSLYLLFYYLGSSVVGSIGGYFWEHLHWPGVIGFNFCLLLGGLILLSLRGYKTAEVGYHERDYLNSSK